MKRILLLFTFLASLSIAQAQDLIIVTSAKNPYMEVLNQARIDPVTNNLGSTSTNTVVCIGEVDFSENYLAAGLTFAQGWGVMAISQFSMLVTATMNRLILLLKLLLLTLNLTTTTFSLLATWVIMCQIPQTSLVVVWLLKG